MLQTSYSSPSTSTSSATEPTYVSVVLKETNTNPDAVASVNAGVDANVNESAINKDWFVHIQNVAGQCRLVAGEYVEFALVVDANGRGMATDVTGLFHGPLLLAYKRMQAQQRKEARELSQQQQQPVETETATDTNDNKDELFGGYVSVRSQRRRNAKPREPREPVQTLTPTQTRIPRRSERRLSGQRAAAAPIQPL